MKRTNLITKLISVILCVFLLAYFAISLVQSVRNPLRTLLAVTAQTEESFFAQGIIIRDETVIAVEYPVVAALVQEGERVSVGMEFLIAYASEADRDRVARRGRLEQEIAYLESQLALGDDMHQTAGVEMEIRRQIQDMNYDIRRGNLMRIEDQTVALRTLVLAEDREGLRLRMESLQSELGELLRADIAAGVTTIVADQAGVYSARLDGFESLGPTDLTRLDVQVVQELIARPSVETPPRAGKLVRGSTWYYVALVSETEAVRLAERLVGDLPNRVLVRFSALEGTEISMRVHALGVPEEGYRVAVFSATTALRETLGLRQVEGRIVCNTFTGIRVPHEALHWGEPNEETGVVPTYLFTLTVNVAERKFVRIIYEGADYYLVQPDTVRTTDAAALREGNTIIVRARDIYNGRVFR